MSFLGYLFPFLFSTIFHGSTHTLHQTFLRTKLKMLLLTATSIFFQKQPEARQSKQCKYLILNFEPCPPCPCPCLCPCYKLKITLFDFGKLFENTDLQSRGTRGAAMDECSVGLDSDDCGNQRLGPGPGLDLTEVRKKKKNKSFNSIFFRWTRFARSWAIFKDKRKRGSWLCRLPNTAGDNFTSIKPFLYLIFYPTIGRFRAVLKRLDGVEKKWMRNSLIMALGGFATKTRSA